MSYLRTIKRFSSTDNLGGIIQLRVARAADVVSIPEPVDGAIPGDIEFRPGTGFVTWDATMESARTRSDSRSSREGAVKSNRKSFLIPRDRQSVKRQLDQAEDDEFIILYTDSNGTRVLFGLQETPVKFEYDHDSGSNFSNLNAYSCRFYFDGPDNRNFYEGAITEQPGISPSIVKYTTGEIVATLSPGDVLIVNSDFAHSFSVLPGSSPSELPAVVKWDDGTIIAVLQPGDTLVVDTDFSFDFEIIGSL